MIKEEKRQKLLKAKPSAPLPYIVLTVQVNNMASTWTYLQPYRPFQLDKQYLGGKLNKRTNRRKYPIEYDIPNCGYYAQLGIFSVTYQFDECVYTITFTCFICLMAAF